MSSLFVLLTFLAAAPSPIRVEIFEQGLSDYKTIPAKLPATSETFDEQAFAFFHLPHRYVYSGVRADRPELVMVRASGDVTLPRGTHRILVRSLGKAKVTIDNKVVIETPPQVNRPDGHQPFKFDQLDLGPKVRLPAPGIAEKLENFTSNGGKHKVVFEFLVGGTIGGKLLRAEINETTLSIALEGEKDFYLLTSTPKEIPYTDIGWWKFRRSREPYYSELEKSRRQIAWKAWAPYWNKRHAYAKQWASKHPASKPPADARGFPINNQIDRFLAASFVTAAEATSAKETKDGFHASAEPIFKARCISCHAGEKAGGGLKLDGAAHLFDATDSGEPAIVAGKPDASELLRRVLSDDEAERMPPPEGGKPLSDEETKAIRQWIAAGAKVDDAPKSPSVLTAPLTDLAFLRKATLDTVGVLPSPAEISQYLADPADKRRSLAIDRLLKDPRWADHWVSYWQETLAENPNLINATLNNTGPFRFWIHEALLDNKPFDVFVTELVTMEGGHYAGGPSGFAMASQNDVPMAEKAAILSSAFLGVNMKCARCHDAPFHVSKQGDLFGIAAMLDRKALTVPKTSSVNVAALSQGDRKPLIKATLTPGTSVDPTWPLTPMVDDSFPLSLLPSNTSLREQLAIQITRPENERFAKVLVNRLWSRLMGTGLVEPVDDWERAKIANEQLLTWLAREFVTSGYDAKQIARLILSSNAYQRAPSQAEKASPDFAATGQRLLRAEQIVDSLTAAFGKPLSLEPLCLDVDVARARNNAIDFGRPKRSWQLTSLANERDRPSLALPETRTIADVLEAFGWRGSRMEPATREEPAPDVSQPATLANGLFMQRMTRITPGSPMEHLVAKATTVDGLIDEVFLRLFTRKPTAKERSACRDLLGPGFEGRVVGKPSDISAEDAPPNPDKYVTWSNHLDGEANAYVVEKERQLRQGPAPSAAIEPSWRERFEDMLWAMANSPEMIFSP